MTTVQMLNFQVKHLLRNRQYDSNYAISVVVMNFYTGE